MVLQKTSFDDTVHQPEHGRTTLQVTWERILETGKVQGCTLQYLCAYCRGVYFSFKLNDESERANLSELTHNIVACLSQCSTIR